MKSSYFLSCCCFSLSLTRQHSSWVRNEKRSEIDNSQKRPDRDDDDQKKRPKNGRSNGSSIESISHFFLSFSSSRERVCFTVRLVLIYFSSSLPRVLKYNRQFQCHWPSWRRVDATQKIRIIRPTTTVTMMMTVISRETRAGVTKWSATTKIEFYYIVCFSIRLKRSKYLWNKRVSAKFTRSNRPRARYGSLLLWCCIVCSFSFHDG